MDEVRRLGDLEGAEIREAKKVLAYEATAICHGKDEAQKSKDGAEAAFGGAGDKAGMPTSEIARDRLTEGVRATELFVEIGLCVSKGEASKLFKSGGGWVGERKLQSHIDVVGLSDFTEEDLVLRAGKKKKHRLVLVG